MGCSFIPYLLLMVKKFHQRPMVLYVEEIEFRPSFPDHGERITLVDVEITKEMAENIIAQLQKRIQHEDTPAIRFRLHGRLVLP